jgi:hypothetical protein
VGNTSSQSNTLHIFTHCCVKRAHLQHVHVTATHKTASIHSTYCCRLHLKCDGTGTETRFHLLAKQTSSFKSVEASVQSTTGSQSVCISSSNAGYTMFQGTVKSTGYPLHLPVSLSLPLPCITMCHHISTGIYQSITRVNGSEHVAVFTVGEFHDHLIITQSSCEMCVLNTPNNALYYVNSV